jgi:hypothetical protein
VCLGVPSTETLSSPRLHPRVHASTQARRHAGTQARTYSRNPQRAAEHVPLCRSLLFLPCLGAYRTNFPLLRGLRGLRGASARSLHRTGMPNFPGAHPWVPIRMARTGRRFRSISCYMVGSVCATMSESWRAVRPPKLAPQPSSYPPRLKTPIIGLVVRSPSDFPVSPRRSAQIIVHIT